MAATPYTVLPVCRSGLRHANAAIFAYTQEPGMIGRLERTNQLFGRVPEEHDAAERDRIRPDVLID